MRSAIESDIRQEEDLSLRRRRVKLVANDKYLVRIAILLYEAV
jgi:hypothetical protein